MRARHGTLTGGPARHGKARHGTLTGGPAREGTARDASLCWFDRSATILIGSRPCVDRSGTPSWPRTRARAGLVRES